MTELIVILGLIALVAAYAVLTYNGLVAMRAKIAEAFSGIDVQLKRRADLVPNLVETVKGYAGHEKSVFENVTKARSALLSATTPAEKSEANNMLTGALKTLFAVAEAYPELKANQNFADLQSQLTDTEDKISYSRSFYNSNVLPFNTKLATFPSNIVASMFGFKTADFFSAGEEEKKKIEVKF